MRLKVVKIISLFIALLLLGTACTDDSIRASADSGLLAALRSAYRSASLVCIATCTGLSKNGEGVSFASLKINETLAGQPPEGELNCKTEDALIGADYVAYLSPDADAWLPVSLIAYHANEAALVQDEETLPLSALREDIALMQSVISAPADLLYYRSAEELLQASDAVFIGRVEQLPALEEKDFREVSGTGTVEHSRPASIVGVQVYGSLKGDLPYGGHISFVYSPAFAGDIVNASSLTAFPCAQSDVPALSQGVYYLFFLKNGPDLKQAYYFGVNPLQSHAALDQDTLLPAPKNEALSSYNELPALISALSDSISDDSSLADSAPDA